VQRPPGTFQVLGDERGVAPVVGGVALILVLGRYGLVGSWLDAWFGLTLFGTTSAVVVAETFVAMPFLVVVAALGVAYAIRYRERIYAPLRGSPGASRASARS